MSVCLACSILENEIEALKSQGLFNHEVIYLTSMLHLYPSKLEILLGREIVKQGGKPTVLIYGDCCPAMLDFSSLPNIQRTKARNCCEMLLGRDRYLKLLREGAFFLMPEWVDRWEEVFLTLMKLKKDVAVDMMGHLHKFFLYIDSGYIAVPEDTLGEISEYFVLPWRAEKIDLNSNFLKVLRGTRDA